MLKSEFIHNVNRTPYVFSNSEVDFTLLPPEAPLQAWVATAAAYPLDLPFHPRLLHMPSNR